MQSRRFLAAALILLAGCRPDPPVESFAELEAQRDRADPFLAGLDFNKAREAVVDIDGGRVSFWTDGGLFQPPSYIDLYIDMTGFADWEKPEAAVRVKAACPTIGGARQSFEKEYRKDDLARYDPETKRALIVIPQVVGTDKRHESANSLGKHNLAVTIESTIPKRTASGTCPIEVIFSRH